MSKRLKLGLAAAVSTLVLAGLPAVAPAAGGQASGHWSKVSGQPKSVKFTVSFKVHTVGFDIRLPSSVKATGLSSPRGLGCHVTFFVLVSCRGALAANHGASGVVRLNKNVPSRLGGHLHGYTGGVGVDGTMTGP